MPGQTGGLGKWQFGYLINKHIMYLKKHFTLTILFCCTVFAVLAQSVIQPYEENSRYWQYQGSPIFLFGGSDNDMFGFQKGISLTTPENKACVAIVKILE